MTRWCAGRGRELKNLGDGLMAAFDGALDAVACAVRIQNEIANARNLDDGHRL